MLISLLIFCASFFVLINTHPLLQTVQSYPVPNYQQNVYQIPYAEAFYVQPNNIQSYSQQAPIQNPSITYHTVKVPSLKEQLNQVYWDKLLANPSLRSILEPSNIVQQYGRDEQLNLYPHNTGGVVNNYIILPPEYLKINETFNNEPTVKKVRNDVRNPEERITSNKKNKKKKHKEYSNNTRNDKSPNLKKMHKVKQNTENTWNFNTDNIKCFTPADVLQNEKYEPDKKIKNKEDKRKCFDNKRKKKPKKKSSPNSESTVESVKPRKNSKVKKKSLENENNESEGKIVENFSSLSSIHKKTKQDKKVSQTCESAKRVEQPVCEIKVVEDIPQYCEQDLNDVLLLNLLQQDCTDSENRQTRNSKSDAATKNFRNIYPDLPSDISKSLTWYINDLLSPHSMQQAPNSNILLGNNIYPFDLSEIYQMSQYYNTDINISGGNSGKNKNTKKKKKKKKKTPKIKSTNDISTDRNDSQILETSNLTSDKSLILKASTETLSASTHIQDTSTRLPDTFNVDSEIPEQSVKMKLESITSTDIEIEPVHIIPIPTGQINTEIISDEDTLEEKIMETHDKHEGGYERKFHMNIINENNTEISENKNRIFSNTLSPPDSQIFNHVPEFKLDDEILSLLINDYYPDFRADNLAYLVSDEEIDVYNINDRYFYTTDKNNESIETYLQEQKNDLFNKKTIYTEDQLENYDVIDQNSNKTRVNQTDKSEEIVFRTPPALEVPDFVTRKINKDRQDSNEIDHQHNNNENNFSRLNLESISDNSNDFIDTAQITHENENSLVETVYAKSKVAKYGQELNKLEAKANMTEERITMRNGDEKTIIIAKSLQPDDYW